LSARRAYDWLREAEEDIESAKLLLDGNQFHHACFHAQQAAEKAIKAALIALGVFIRGHSVTILMRELSRYVTVPGELIDKVRILDQYYIPPRYPNAFDEGAPADYYTKEQAENAIMIAEEVVEFARRIIEGTLRESR